MKVSVVVCTYNRAYILKDCLYSLIDQDFPKKEYEILVIDNCSTDNTEGVVFEIIKKNPELSIRYIYEDKSGLSNARNRGYKDAFGEIVLYIDDDATACQSWIKHHYESYEDKKIGCVGGKILIKFPDELNLPQWVLKEGFGYLDYGDESCILYGNKYIFGGNMSIRREILVDIGGFDVKLGRVQNKLFIGEEIDLQNRIRKKNYYVFYNPKALIYHHITKERITKKYFYETAKSHYYLTEYELRHKNIKDRIVLFFLYVYRIVFYSLTFIKNFILRREKHIFYAKFMVTRSFYQILGFFNFIKKIFKFFL